MVDSKGLEVFSFQFSLPRTAISCPNCGHSVCGSILDKVAFPKTFVLICCGSVIYWSFSSNNPRLISSIFSSAKEIIQNGLMTIISVFASSSTPTIETSEHPSSSSSSSSSSKTTTRQSFSQSNTTNNVFNQYYQCQSNSIRNQLVVNTFDDTQNDSTDFSSLNLSPLNSIGAGTLDKLDNMLEEVAQIKMYVNDSCNEIKWFNNGGGEGNGDCSQSISLASLPQPSNRRMSEGEITLPSLEWDLNDVHFDEDTFNNNDNNNNNNSSENLDEDGFREQNNFGRTHHHHQARSNDNFIDYETLSEIIFNKDFELKDERFFRMKKQFLNMKQRLKFISKTQARQQHQQYQYRSSSNNINSSNYRTNRDSAFFEDLQ